MQKLPEAPDRKYGQRMRIEKEPFQQKKETCSLSAVTVGLKTPISFLLLVKGPCPFLCGTLVNLFISSGHFCY